MIYMETDLGFNVNQYSDFWWVFLNYVMTVFLFFESDLNTNLLGTEYLLVLSGILKEGNNLRHLLCFVGIIYVPVSQSSL